MLEKLATHDIQDVPELFSLVDKCARATEGHAWHTTPILEAGKESKPNAGAATQGSSSSNNNNNNKKKVGGNNQPLVAAPTATAVVAGGAEDHKATSASTKSSVAMMVAPNAWFITLRAIA
jgi:hypothetical protein